MRVMAIALEGHLDIALLDERLAPVEAQLKRDTEGFYGLLIDVRKMTGYDRGARAQYIKWHQQYRSRLKGVAVITHNVVLRMAVAGVGLAAGGRIKPFDSDHAAKSWLETLS